MSDISNINREPMMEMYVFETNQLMEQLEEILLTCEKSCYFSGENINEIFRIMHTIKGSSAMMMFSNILSLAHSVEDLFYYIRQYNIQNIDCSSVCDLVFSVLDFIRCEVRKIEDNNPADGNEAPLAGRIKEYLKSIKDDNLIDEHVNDSCYCDEEDEKQKFYISKYAGDKDEVNRFTAKVFFEKDCLMENIRAFTVVHNLKEICKEIYHRPVNLFDNEYSENFIIENGFELYITSKCKYEDIDKCINQTLFIKSVEIKQVETYEEEIQDLILGKDTKRYLEDAITGNEMNEEISKSNGGFDILTKNKKKNIISVNVDKLDKLMDLVGEIVITESMVTKNPDLAGLELDNFNKSARQLRKLNDELQDIVMSIRMIPVGPTFHKMHRIVRDMTKKLGKKAELIVLGEETEVDKNIIDNLSDPLMHLIRNSMDHGIEPVEERIEKGKPEKGRIILEASNTGGDVVIRISDDGKGLNREEIIKKATENNLLTKPETEMSDRDVFSLILLPGFSTKDNVTEFSGRGVGMDVVKKCIDKVGGRIQVESTPGKGTTISIKIPLTLAIIDGIEISVGRSIFTLPTISIKESFKANQKDLIEDNAGNEMIMIRGNCYPIIRLHKLYNINTGVTHLCEGIMVMVEGNNKSVCIFVDQLIGEQQVVVKPIPAYLAQYSIKNSGIAGCAILGDGNISLIIDVISLINKIL